MDFKYNEFFDFKGPDAYERLLLDAMVGDQTLFVCCAALELAWKLLPSLLY